MTKLITTEIKETSKPAKYRAGFAGAVQQTDAEFFLNSNPITVSEVDKLEAPDIKEYQKVVELCRFFYRKDPIAGTVINKLVDIGVTDLIVEGNGLSENEFRVFTGIKKILKEMATSFALEWLISGLVLPQINYLQANKSELKTMGVKKHEIILIPKDFWLVAAENIKINTSMFSSKPSYYLEIPSELIQFVREGGRYPDGTQDLEALARLEVAFPTLVLAIRSDKKEFQLIGPNVDLIVRRRPLSDTPYPTPYLYNAIESLKHKRNLIRMDYSLASRVITAILHVKVGDKDFPAVEQDQDRITYLQNQLAWRYTTLGRYEIERIFQLVTDHTIEMKWVFPDVQTLLNDGKFIPVNQDIFFALGFPRILTTGETERSSSSDPEFASMSPVKTMETMRTDILSILEKILARISELNNFKSIPTITFTNINLHSFRNFVEGMIGLYQAGNLSRTNMSAAFGYNWDEEMRLKSEEKKTLEELNLEEVPQMPFSSPQVGGSQPKDQEKSQKSPTDSKKDE